ncbi:Ppx/GppA phosphatase family protein [Arvimicrobium flavum]|uniref:Ppx/GppA phosphatase family protein n=1 Tax=Arvimicrobium flavum TaxID=3393320 RepID=UPI00237BE682|nr:Ppx/GppA phosphatase family protein [Mesorhizobium shangrilense]
MTDRDAGQPAGAGAAGGAMPRAGDSRDGARRVEPASAESGSPASALRTPRRKGRKRKRGRKVFAKGSPQAQTAGAASVPHVNGQAAGAVLAKAAPGLPPAHQQIPPAADDRLQKRPRSDLPVFAALDLGTNNCRLLVAIPGRPGQFRVIDAFSRIVRLGEGLAASGRLGQGGMDRAVEALKVCADKLASRDIRRSRLIATEACRSAENGDVFIDRVKRETGLDLEIIDRQTEARLAVSGCGPLVERDTHGVVLFDIGGGSSEIALIDTSRHRTPRLANHIVAWTSLPVGVVSLAERFGGQEVSRETFDAMIEEVLRHLMAFAGRDRLRHVAHDTRFHLLGTSGTVTTLAGVHLGLERYDRRRVDGLWMDRENVDRMVNKLLGWNFDQRVANACIGADRADLVLAGCAILEAIRRIWPSERLRVADRGLREGILSELMADEGVWRRNWRPEGRA